VTKFVIVQYSNEKTAPRHQWITMELARCPQMEFKGVSFSKVPAKFPLTRLKALTIFSLTLIHLNVRTLDLESNVE